MFCPTSSLTFDNAGTVLEAGMQAIASGETEFDLSQLTTIDSAAVATLIAWRRAAADKGRHLHFHHLPSSLHSLMHLYGVEMVMNH